MREKKLAALGLGTLTVNGFRYLLDKCGYYSSVETCDWDTFSANPDKYDAYFISSSIFVAHVEFFMPRKKRTVVVSGTCRIESPSQIISIFYDDEDDAVQRILHCLLECDKMEDTARGDLSLREMDVLKEIASGKSNKEIADQLNISVNTVITHRKNITTKLGIRSASGLSLYAIMNGLI